jgi:hypothetical protein
MPPPGAYAGWGDAPYPPRQMGPGATGPQRMRRAALKPWMLVVGALVMAAVAFAVTRAFLS